MTVTMSLLKFLLILYLVLSAGSFIGIIVTAFFNASNEDDHHKLMEDDGK